MIGTVGIILLVTGAAGTLYGNSLNNGVASQLQMIFPTDNPTPKMYSYT